MCRLFPFNRGLLHAYWAPNAWALYAAADVFASKALAWTGLRQQARLTSVTAGLVQEASFAVLPKVLTF
jgi:alpha-1,3-glucosyltransferase